MVTLPPRVMLPPVAFRLVRLLLPPTTSLNATLPVPALTTSERVFTASPFTVDEKATLLLVVVRTSLPLRITAPL